MEQGHWLQQKNCPQSTQEQVMLCLQPLSIADGGKRKLGQASAGSSGVLPTGLTND